MVEQVVVEQAVVEQAGEVMVRVLQEHRSKSTNGITTINKFLHEQ